MDLYELAASDRARLFSPHFRRVRFALAAKALEARTIPWRFTQQYVRAPHGAEKVMVGRTPWQSPASRG
jgi:glutathione S-transferase